MGYIGNTDRCSGCLGTGWLPGWDCECYPPHRAAREVCPICKGWGRVGEVDMYCESPKTCPEKHCLCALGRDEYERRVYSDALDHAMTVPFKNGRNYVEDENDKARLLEVLTRSQAIREINPEHSHRAMGQTKTSPPAHLRTEGKEY